MQYAPTVSGIFQWCQFFLDLGADPHLKDSRGFTALGWCILQGGYVPVMRRLLTAGAYIPPGPPTYDRSNMIWYSVDHDHGISALLASGASVFELA
jgi:ankyrin repeat protein